MSFEGLERLLVGSVPMACANLSQHLNLCMESDTHAKSFYEFLPKLCQILFGSKESRGWLHLPLSKADENPLYELLRPQGALMRFLLNRCTDTAFIYEMVPDFLPKRTQSKMDPTQYHTLPSIYLSRVNLTKTTAPVGTEKTMTQITKVNLNFNMLEYFLFYFAYALTLDDDDVNGRGMRRTDVKLAFRINRVLTTNPTADGNRQSSWSAGNISNAPTSRVLVDGSFFELYHRYLQYFLPAPKQPSATTNAQPGTEPRKPAPTVFNDKIMDNSADRGAISEFFTGTLVELWMGQNDRSVDNRSVRYIQPGSDVAACISVLIGHLASHDISQYVLGGDQVNTQKSDKDNYAIKVHRARKSAYQCVRPELYNFLRVGMAFWPLDDTFPSFIDVWITWITPWHLGRREPPATGDDVQEKWQPFVFENLLFYTNLLKIYLARLSNPPQTNRSTLIPALLTLSKELRSIQKVMKAYKATNLKEILKIAEQVLVYPENFTEFSHPLFDPLMDGKFTGVSARNDATMAFLASMTNALQIQVFQLEGQQFIYEPLFLVDGPGLGRCNIRMILTKLGNAVDLREERLALLEAKNKATLDKNGGWDLISSALNGIFSPPPPKTVSQDPAVYQRDIKALRETMTMVGDVFDLYPDVVTSFEKHQQGSKEGGSSLTPDQIEAMIPPLDDLQESTGLLGPENRRKFVPRSLERPELDSLKGRGPRVQELVLSYEVESLVRLTRAAEDKLAPWWQSVLRRANSVVPLPQAVLASRIRLRWLASVPTLTYLLVALLAMVFLLMISARWGQDDLARQPQRLRQTHINQEAQEDRHGSRMRQYNAHVQPVHVHVPVYTWERPNEASKGHDADSPFTRPSRTGTAESKYTIELGWHHEKGVE